MEKLLFYSTSLNKHLKNNTWNKSVIMDYFDIEVQKVLSMLGFAYKNNPSLIVVKQFINVQNVISSYNIDTILSLNDTADLLGKEIIGVIYECHPL